MENMLNCKESMTVALNENRIIRFANWKNSICNSIIRSVYAGYSFILKVLNLPRGILEYNEQYKNFCTEMVDKGYSVREYFNHKTHKRYLFISFADGDDCEFLNSPDYCNFQLQYDYNWR